MRSLKKKKDVHEGLQEERLRKGKELSQLFK